MNEVVKVRTQFGTVATVWEDALLSRIELGSIGSGAEDDSSEDDLPGFAIALIQRLGVYFRGGGDVLNGVAPIPQGSAFQMRVWEATVEVPYGETVSYGDLARAIGAGAESARAVGSALNRNPLPLIVPCHRVVSSTGDLTGFAAGLAWKRALIGLEMSQISLAL